MIVIFVVSILLLVSFALAWRSLPEFRQEAEKWGTIVFLKGREIFYSGEEEDQ